MNTINPALQIEFRKKRDPGQVLTASFQFIRLYSKPLFTGILFFVVPFFLLAGILFGTAFSEIYLLIVNTVENSKNSSIDTVLLSILMIGLGVIAFFIGTIFLTNVVNELIVLAYNNKGRIPTVRELWVPVRKHFWLTLANYLLWYVMSGIVYLVVNIIVYMFAAIGAVISVSGGPILGGIVMFIGVLVLYAVMLYYYACTIPMFFITSFENKNVIDAMVKSIRLFHARKANFWGGILVGLLAIMVLYVFYMMLTPLASIIIGFIFYNNGVPANFDEGTMVLKIVLIMYGVVMLFAPLSTVINFTSAAFKYFDMAERADFAGLRERVKTIGTTKDFDPASYEDA